MSKWILVHDADDGHRITVNVNHISAIDAQDNGSSSIIVETKIITKVKVRESVSEIMQKVADT